MIDVMGQNVCQLNWGRSSIMMDINEEWITGRRYMNMETD